MTATPPRWTVEQFTVAADTSTARFRELRMQEPLEQYLHSYEDHRSAVEALLERTDDLAALHLRAPEVLLEPELLTAVRFLASPFISADDLKTVAQTTLSASALRADDWAGARRVVDAVLLGLDRHRFPWVGEDRPPTDAERDTAVVATASLAATQSVQTARRTSSKDDQEQRVADYLVSRGFAQVPPRAMASVTDLPAPGEFCREALFGSRKADLVVRTRDGRAMPIECKVSNSSINSVKRLNNDAAVKAVVWLQEFGHLVALPAALLSGVFKVANLTAAQDQGLTLFWEHDLDALGAFLDAAVP